ncbi:hypothetical protein DSO57_1011568 [Entomophthora muscae]|uniref:Uncharacterized protein n=1 Tax=Entomophthora muscae TaxID=34485 RepID=A0ACC2SVE8_9FUNG|nr:hypothetical protein DSO57_1011568 [Entomophthora muscae]
MLSKKKLIYVAFGTIVYLENYQVKAILEGLVQALEDRLVDSIIWTLVSTHYSQLPQTIRLRGKTVGFEELLKDYPIKIMEYAPQVAILQHPATKVFLSHCGIESTFEGLLAGVPFLAVPFFGDQLTNAGNLEANGVAIAVDRHVISKDKVYQAISLLSLDRHKMFAANVERMNRITFAASFNKLRAVSLIEQIMFLSRALENPASALNHLVTQDNHMHWFFRHNLDMYLIVILTISVLLFIVFRLISIVGSIKLWIGKLQIQDNPTLVASTKDKEA